MSSNPVSQEDKDQTFASSVTSADDDRCASEGGDTITSDMDHLLRTQAQAHRDLSMQSIVSMLSIPVYGRGARDSVVSILQAENDDDDMVESSASRISVAAAAEERRKMYVYVQVVYRTVGEIDTVGECFSAEVGVHSRWREPLHDGTHQVLDETLGYFWNPKLYIENSVQPPQVTVRWKLERNEYGEAMVVEHKVFKGSFVSNSVIQHFPFDLQEMVLIVKSKRSLHEMDLLDDPLTVHRVHRKTFIDQQKFKLYKYVDSFYPSRDWDEYHNPNLLVKCVAARRWEYYLTNLFFMSFVMGLMIMYTFVVDIRIPKMRIYLMHYTFMASVSFKYVIVTQTPKISTFTSIEMYYLGIQIFILLTSYYQSWLTRVEDNVQKHHIDMIAICAYGGVFLLFNVVFVLWVLIVPFQPRRMMRAYQKNYLDRLQKLNEMRESSVNSEVRISARISEAIRTSYWHEFTQ